MAKAPLWTVAYRLDNWPETAHIRAGTSAEAAFKAALDLADRGFGERVEFTSVTQVVSRGNEVVSEAN